MHQATAGNGDRAPPLHSQKALAAGRLVQQAPAKSTGGETVFVHMDMAIVSSVQALQEPEKPLTSVRSSSCGLSSTQASGA